MHWKNNLLAFATVGGRRLLNWVVFGSLIIFSAYLYILAAAPLAAVTRHAFVKPVIALFLGIAVAGEGVSAGEWIAGDVLLAGVFLISRGKTPQKLE